MCVSCDTLTLPVRLQLRSQQVWVTSRGANMGSEVDLGPNMPQIWMRYLFLEQRARDLDIKLVNKGVPGDFGTDAKQHHTNKVLFVQNKSLWAQ